VIDNQGEALQASQGAINRACATPGRQLPAKPGAGIPIYTTRAPKTLL
jgi:hypothetical protein